MIAPDEDAKREVMSGLEERGLFCHSLALESGVRGETKNDPELVKWLGS